MKIDSLLGIRHLNIVSVNFDNMKWYFHFSKVSYYQQNIYSTVYTVKSRFYVSRFYLKTRIYVEKYDDQIESLLNKVSQFYIISRFYDTVAADQQ